MSYRYNEPPADLRIPDRYGLSVDDEAELRELAWSWILRGDTDTDDFVEFVLDDEEFAPPLSEDAVTEIFEAFVRARRAQQSAWTDEEVTTDLSRAFDELAEIGVLARQNFWCCGTCANDAIGDERDDSREWRGYVYFHSQDTESLLEDRSTYIGYGAFLDAHLSEAEWDALGSSERTTSTSASPMN